MEREGEETVSKGQTLSGVRSSDYCAYLRVAEESDLPVRTLLDLCDKLSVQRVNAVALRSGVVGERGGVIDGGLGIKSVVG